MQTIIVTAPAGLPVAAQTLVRLSPAQAAARNVAVIDRQKGIYRLLRDAQFKRGEEIGFEGEMPKGFAELVDTAAEAKARAEAAAAAAGAAEAAILSRVAEAVQAEQARLFALTPEAFAAERDAAAAAAATAKKG